MHQPKEYGWWRGEGVPGRTVEGTLWWLFFGLPPWSCIKLFLAPRSPFNWSLVMEVWIWSLFPYFMMGLSVNYLLDLTERGSTQLQRHEMKHSHQFYMALRSHWAQCRSWEGQLFSLNFASATSSQTGSCEIKNDLWSPCPTVPAPWGRVTEGHSSSAQWLQHTGACPIFVCVLCILNVLLC